MIDLIKNAVAYNIPFWVLTILTAFLLIGAAFTPPLFVIDSSIIAAVGEVCGLGALWAVVKALDKGTNTTLKHGQTELEIKNGDE